MNGPVRVGIVGMGNIAYMHEAGYSEQPDAAQIVAVCDADAAIAGQRAAAYDAKIYTDFHALIADPDVDLIDITVPHRLHARFVVEALTAGKHVLVEKPLAVNVIEGETVIRAVKAAGTVCAVAENTRFVAAYQAVAPLVASGELGTLRLVRTIISGSEAARIRDRTGWVGKTRDRGVILDSGVHTFYLFRWLFGGVRELRAFPLRLLEGGETEDHAVLLGTLGNGAHFEATLSCAIEAPWTERLEVYGSRGSLIVDHLANPTAVLYRGPEDLEGSPLPEVPFEPLAWKYLSIVAEVQDVVQAIRDGRPPLVTVDDGFYTVRVADAAYQSIAEQRVVTLG